uniref:Coiled-coil domain-containing protein 39 n=1 Tax=Trichobilharzia regenti TaxID=157069 RepID=A0AA85IKC2_TRIRE|nr:unnamed protein product [Trichobilharzia regenti]
MSSPSDTNDHLIAQPPKEYEALHVESQTEVASSAAYQSIDEQFHLGKLTSTEVAMLKARYVKLYEALKKTRDNEFNLIQLTKRFISEIESQHSELAKADLFPDNALTEPSQLRAQILSHYNTAMETDERVEMLLYEAGLLREERKLLSRDYSRLPTSELENLGDDMSIFQEMERRVKLLQGQCQELWLEIDVLKMEGKRTRELYRQTSETEQDLINEHTEALSRLSDVKAEWVVATDLPGQYSKETEKARKYKSNAEKDLQLRREEHISLQNTRADYEELLRKAEMTRERLREDLSIIRQTILDKKQSLEDSNKLYDNWFEMEMMNRTEKARLLQRALLAEQNKKDLIEDINKVTKERDNINKLLRNLITAIEVVKESLKVVQQIHNRTRARFVVSPKYDGELMEKKRRLQIAIQMGQQELQEEYQRAENEQAKTSQCVMLNERRLMVLEHARAENWELLRLISNLTDGLTKAVREHTCVRKKSDRLSEELWTKNMEITEQTRKLEELGSRLTEISKCYAKAKLERNKFVGLLQTSIKLALDTRERLKLHTNEAEILMFNLQKRDAQLTKERKLFATVIVQRDHKRHHVCKLAEMNAKQLQKREQLQMSIQQINTIYSQTEAETLSIRKAKERNARLRNEKAIQLIERNQEVYILQERLSAQAAAGNAAELSLRGLEEEIGFLKLYRTQLSNYIQVINKNGPKIDAMKTELRGLIHELIASRVKLNELVRQAEDPDSEGRLRILGGKDPSQLQLWMSLGQLERRMAAKEEDMAEKNLTYEAVCRLVDSLQVKANAGKDDTLTLAIEINKVKSSLKNNRNKMKTLYAELIITAGERNRMRRYIEKLEHHLDICEIYRSNGDEYSANIEHLLLKHSHSDRTKKKRKLNKPLGPTEIKPMRPPGTMPNRYNSISTVGLRTQSIYTNNNTTKTESLNKNQSADQNQKTNESRLVKLPSLWPGKKNSVVKRMNQTEDRNVHCPEITNLPLENIISIRVVTPYTISYKQKPQQQQPELSILCIRKQKVEKSNNKNEIDDSKASSSNDEISFASFNSEFQKLTWRDNDFDTTYDPSKMSSDYNNDVSQCEITTDQDGSDGDDEREA